MMNRRRALRGIGAALPVLAALGSPTRSAAVANDAVFYAGANLPRGIRSRRVDTRNGVTLHVLEAGYAGTGRPCVVLLHGFPELAYSWRHQLLPLAAAGFHAVAPDLRGYGLSASAAVAYEDDLRPYSMPGRVADVLGLVRALGYEHVAAVAGHDWGGPTAQWCARLRPDVFRSVVSLSTPFRSTPSMPPGDVSVDSPRSDLDRELAELPRPRKHYMSYSASRAANEDMWHAPQGVHDLLRAMYHFKSADWPGNRPFALASWSAEELAKLPEYYVMDRDLGIAQTMARAMPSRAQIAACRWMTEADLRVYSREFERTGFQGGLNYYRVAEDAAFGAELRAFAGRTIDVPALFIGGDRDWATHQAPGAFESMRLACTRGLDIRMLERAGHSLGEEQPEAVSRELVRFLRQVVAT